MKVLDVGGGWGSFTLFAVRIWAEPMSHIRTHKCALLHFTIHEVGKPRPYIVVLP